MLSQDAAEVIFWVCGPVVAVFMNWTSKICLLVAIPPCSNEIGAAMLQLQHGLTHSTMAHMHDKAIHSFDVAKLACCLTVLCFTALHSVSQSCYGSNHLKGSVILVLR